VAAFAWGTETLRPVDVIAGPGGRYVEAAKRLVRGVVGVDLDAGPSEVLVLALDDADPELVAADLLSEAEHGPDSSAVGVLTDPARAAAVVAALERRLSALPPVRQAYVRTQVADGRSALVVVPDAATAEAFAEEIASEHVVVHAADPEAVAGRLRRAGTVCVGPWSPSPAGSYVAGTNHVLPTGGSARHASGVSVDSFRRRQSFERLTAEGLAAVRDDVGVYAAYEGLPAHRAAVEARFRTAADG
jgi:histidinol dehydrogenase